MRLILRGVAVEVPLLLDVIAQHLIAWHVGWVDVVRFEHILNFHKMSLIEEFASVDVFIGLKIALDKGIEQHAEHIGQTIGRHFGIVEHGIDILGQIELAVDDTLPAIGVR